MDDRRTIPPILPAEPQGGIRVVAMSDVGCVREENQDFMGWFAVDGRQLLVVADGMGGHSGGFEASRIAVDAVRQAFLEDVAGLEPPALMAEAMGRANARVREAADRSPLMRGMGTTVVMALVRGERAWLAHVGDSRCYLVRGGRATLLTIDHSRVNRLVEAGLIPAEAAADHPMGHILERSVGSEAEVQAEVTPEPLALLLGDRLMLCSDGLWGLVSDAEIGDLFASGPLRDCVRGAIDLALARGADDNTTIAAMEVVQGASDPDAPTPPGAREALVERARAGTAQIASLQRPEDAAKGTGLASRGLGLLAGAVLVTVLLALALLFRLLHGELRGQGLAQPEPPAEAAVDGDKEKQGAVGAAGAGDRGRPDQPGEGTPKQGKAAPTAQPGKGPPAKTPSATPPGSDPTAKAKPQASPPFP